MFAAVIESSEFRWFELCRARSLFAANTPGRTVTVFSKPAKSWFSTDTRRTEMHLTAFVGASRSTSDVS